MADIEITFPDEDEIVITFDAIPISTGGGGGGTITVKDSDGSPSVSADTLIMPNGTVTDSGSGDATFNPSGRYGSGSSIVITDYLFGSSSSSDTKWSIDKLVDFLVSKNNTFFNQWLDDTPFAGFELSDLLYNTYKVDGTNGIFAARGGVLANTTGTLSGALSNSIGHATTITQASAGANGTLSIAYSPSGGYLLRGGSAGVNGFIVFNLFSVNGSNWNNTGASTGARFCSGLTSNSNMTTLLGTDNPAVERAIFMRSHVNGGLTETNWMFSTRDATTENRVSTGVPFNAGGAIYATMIACAPQGGTIYYRIKDFTNNNDSGLLSTTSNLPQATTFMSGAIGFRNIDAVSRSLSIAKSRAYVRNFLS